MLQLPPELLNELANKWLKGTISPEEIDMLDQWYNQQGPEEINWSSDDLSEEALKNRLFNNVQHQLGSAAALPGQSKKMVATDRVKKLWPRIAVAAAVMITLGAGLWFFKYSADGHTTPSPEFTSGSPDIPSGKNTAILTLANGKTIRLSDQQTGVVIQDDKIVYNDGSSLRDGEPGSVPQMLMASTPRGGTYQITLPDGTKVWLNAASSLKFSSNFANEPKRSVELDGEAYFEVFKDKTHPFTVKSRGQEVEVLGTHFNINSYSNEPGVKTTLVEGSVRVTGLNTQQIVNRKSNIVTLKPNQQSVLKGETISLQGVDIEQVLAWKNGIFMFDDEGLESIMNKIARWYDMQIVYENKPEQGLAFQGKITRNRNLSEVLKMIEYTGSVHFKIEGRKLIVTK